ncbi:succinate dehydrogenase assembly factor 2 [Immundisolibacter sp.]|uniref:FAD assembly factor SdhE n=1 Tax=Immundisolibacter sp. TaxID=1934948 RepID=UPI00356AAFA0
MISDSMLRWRCRRGKQELDILLRNFLDQHLTRLNGAQRAAFERLLEMEDDDLLDLLYGRVAAADPETAALLPRLSGRA